MKGDEPSIYTATGVILAIVVISYFVFFFSEGTVERASAETPEKYIECRYNIDCENSLNGELCLTIEGSEPFCGCLESSSEGGCKGGENCVENICV